MPTTQQDERKQLLILTLPPAPCGCGVYLGEECDCAQFAATAARLLSAPLTMHTRPASEPAQASSDPQPLILRNVGGLLRPVPADTNTSKAVIA